MTNQRVAGRYTLQHEIGRGAHGAVWAAYDEVLGRTVALKRLGRASGPGIDAARAEREARLAAQLGHPNVVAVYDLVTDDGDTWLVMEKVDGQALSAVVRDAPLSPDDAARLLAPVADALAHAHGLGIVHRDVKPSNILAGPEGAKLTDFGIARGSGDATLTRTGLVTGSPAYLAPEVAVGGQATPASDVWSLGATLVHLLTGRPPYHRDDLDNAPLAVVYRIAHEDPPVVAGAGWLAPLLATTMAKDPQARPTMAEVRDQLARTAHAAEHTMALPAVPAIRRTSRVAAAAVAALVLALLVVAVLALRPDGDRTPTTRDTPSSSGGPTGATGPTTSPATPTAAELEEFARTYVATASSDPDRGLAMLTPAYQAKSPDYASFWGKVKNPEIVDLSADPARMSVTYRYSYVLQGQGRRREWVTLFLVDQGGNLLIDNASAG
ncbi:serine/threonine-protein kinase [Nocardioides daeguensis]|uniref:non-specific serine/threonine protein kinase n=1 Tax=Nocardioides daeguensis TaxID=908359 RepID=A0ABP6WN94_9ACTN|nr:serine/threonine-protein kinase [Nocardioides daeguensis]MBV6729542.1 serine/threonine protein kinase [Nocardioides daeguensis]MCR1774974.1 serine/threonine protein kinase [Nocardioides daeguensis]